MSPRILRALLLLVNLALLVGTCALGWRMWGEELSAMVYQASAQAGWELEFLNQEHEVEWAFAPPKIDGFGLPVLHEDPRLREKRLYITIADVFERPAPPAAPLQATTAQPTRVQAPSVPPVQQIQVRLLQYNYAHPERSSALLVDPTTDRASFFMPGHRIDLPGRGFERFRGVEVKRITEAEVILVAEGKNIHLPGPRGDARR